MTKSRPVYKGVIPLSADMIGRIQHARGNFSGVDLSFKHGLLLCDYRTNRKKK